MKTLSIMDPELSKAVQETLTVLLRNGISMTGKHHIAAAVLRTLGLSIPALRQLVKEGVVEAVNMSGGQIWRPAGSIANEVEVLANGDVDITLNFDLT